MDYKNFIVRSIISFTFLIIYLCLLIYNFEYLYYLIISIYIIILFEIIIFFKKYKFLLIIYLLFSLILFNLINFTEKTLINFNLMIITIITFDIFSYIFGNQIGKTKILPIISPNKTLEGLLGGLFFAIISSLIYCFIFQINLTFLISIFILLIISSSLIGDIIESFFKRINNLKDSSNLIPGHGGFFDRFDSFIFSIITYYFFFNFI